MAFTVTLAGNARQFSVETGETVLDGARRAGLALPYSCLGGRCGSCKATIVAGECHYPRQPASALDEAERAHHDALLCQAVPMTDLTIAAREVPSVADFPRRQLALKVTAKDVVAPDVVRVLLKPPRGERLRWLAGQYLDVLLPEGKRRAFSIANAPEEGDHVELHIRHVPGGGFTQWVFAEMPIGAVWRIEGPLGTFVPREDSERPIVMVAGGTGFAPLKAIVEHFLHLRSTRPLHVFRGVRDEAELYLRGLPIAWARRHPALHHHSVLSEPKGDQALRHATGFVHEAVLRNFPDLSPFDVYMSGPPALIEAGRRAFVAAGLPEQRLYYDSFEYAPDVLAAILRARAGIGA